MAGNEIKSNIKISDTPAFRKAKVSPWSDIWYYLRKLGIYIVALTVCYAAYSTAKDLFGKFEKKEKYEAAYEVYRNSLCDLLSAKGLATRECDIPLDRFYDSNYPRDLERVLDNALLRDGIKANLHNVPAFTDTEEIFKNIVFYKVAPNGYEITNEEAPLTDVSLAINKYLRR